jgi:hypothetical protein
MTNLINGVKGAFSNLVELGKNIVDGIWQGIKDAWGNLVSGFKDLLRGLFNSGQEEIDANSPSRVWAKGIGAPMAEGIGFGFLGEMDAVERSMRMTIAGLMPAVESAFPAGGMQPAFAGVGQANVVDRAPVTINVNPSEPIDYELLANKVARKVAEGW